MSNDNFQNEHADLQSLFQRTQPQETAVDVSRIINRNNELSQLANSADSQRRHKVVSRTIVMLLVAAVVVLLLNLPQTSTERVAFAQVQAQVEQVRTVDYVQTSFIAGEQTEDVLSTRFGVKSPLTLVKQLVESLEVAQKSADPSERTEIAFRLKLLRPYLTTGGVGLPEDIQRIRIKGKHLQRTDDIFPFGEFHSLLNAKTGENLSFNHDQKTMTRLTTQVVINRESGETKEYPVKFSPAVDFFQRFRGIPEEATEKLPGKEIDGRQAVGFRSVENHESGTWTRTFWVDEKTKLPVQIVTEFQSEQKGLSSSKWIQDHFVFDKELDDALFDTKTPEGYTAKEDKIYGFE